MLAQALHYLTNGGTQINYLYMRRLPIEAKQFDKWNRVNEDIDLTKASQEEKANYASLTKETKNSLEQAIKYWQQSWYIILLHRLKHK